MFGLKPGKSSILIDNCNEVRQKGRRHGYLTQCILSFFVIPYLVNFETLDLGLVIQESRVFSETPLKPKKCELVLMKLLYLIYNGTKLTEQDATTVFFAITKTFQSKEVIFYSFHTILNNLASFETPYLLSH